MTPNHVTAWIIQAYAAQVIEEYGDDEAQPLFHAALNTLNDDETCAIGRAILSRHESLADQAYRFGHKRYPSELAEIAKRLAWEG